MKSNFVALKKFRTKLFQLINKVEESYIKNDHSSIPNKMRIFCEALIKDCLKIYSKASLGKIIPLFATETNRDPAYKAALRIKSQGDLGSHDNKVDWNTETSNKLFKDATILVNYFLRDFHEQKIKEIIFSPELLLEDLTDKQDQGKAESIQQENKDLQNIQVSTETTQIQEEDDQQTTEINLDTQQQTLISLNKGKHFLIAPPGSGKTKILSARLKIALEKYKNDNDIVCLTFTNRAADAMKQQASKFIGTRQPFIGTFHTFCLHQIRNSNNGINQEIKRHTILDDKYKKIILQSVINDYLKTKKNNINKNENFENWLTICQEYNQPINDNSQPTKDLKEAIKNFISSFSKAYLGMLLLVSSKKQTILVIAQNALKGKIKPLMQATANLFRVEPANIEELATINLQILYNFIEEKKRSKMIEFDDILCQGLFSLIQQQKNYAFVQIDEVQDLSPLQWHIANSICDENTHVFIAGDPKQSIYGFLGADIESLNAHTSDYSQHDLTINYRSSSQIIQLLNNYRKINWGLAEIETSTAITNMPNPQLVKYNDNQQEIVACVQTVADIIKQPNNNVGILLRTNDACKEFCDQLDIDGIDYFAVSKYDLMQNNIIQDWLSLLRIYQRNAGPKDWWRITYRFAKEKSGFKKAKAMSMVNSLDKLGVSIADVTSINVFDTNTNNTLVDYPTKRLIDAFNNKGVIVFDIQTTTDTINGEITELAALKIINGSVVKTFNRKIIAKDDANSLTSIGHDFFDFVSCYPLITYNISFTQAILRFNLQSITANYQLLKSYHKMHSQQSCLLTLIQQLFSKLSSDKLADSIVEFKLEGCTTNTALNKAKATASLLNIVIVELQNKIDDIDNILTEYQNFIQPIVRHRSEIDARFNALVEGGKETHLSFILIEWLEYIKQQPKWYNYNLETLNKIETDIHKKLIPWLENNGYSGIFNDLIDNKSLKAEELFGLKEIDLIDKKIHQVVVSTVHGSKGLEFETVLVPYANSANYPSYLKDKYKLPLSKQKKHDEEGRHLLYVALSRAISNLIVSYHLNCFIFKYNKFYDRSISPFLKNPPDDVFDFSTKNI